MIIMCLSHATPQSTENIKSQLHTYIKFHVRFHLLSRHDYYSDDKVIIYYELISHSV